MPFDEESLARLRAIRRNWKESKDCRVPLDGGDANGAVGELLGMLGECDEFTVMPEGESDARWLRQWQELSKAHRDDKTALELLELATIAGLDTVGEWLNTISHRPGSPEDASCDCTYCTMPTVLRTILAEWAVPPTCSWCDNPAVARGDDGTLSCAQGQGDRLEHHCNMGVKYTSLSSGFAWQRIQ